MTIAFRSFLLSSHKADLKHSTIRIVIFYTKLARKYKWLQKIHGSTYTDTCKKYEKLQYFVHSILFCDTIGAEYVNGFRNLSHFWRVNN